MRNYSLSHVSDAALARDLAAAAARDRAATANLLANIAEFDARKLYVPAAHPSMFSYCVGELRLSEDAAYKRIQAARAARKFPAIFEAVADGRLHLTAIVMLGPWLTPENAGELLAAATHKCKPEIELLLATRFPQPDLPARVEAISAESNGQLVPEPVGASAGAMQLVPEPVEAPGQRPKVQPLAADRYGIQFTADQETYDLLGDAQALLGLPSRDLAQVFKRALKVLVRELEKRKFAATDRPRPRHHRASSNPRYVPARVKLAVWKRDQGQCTFKNEGVHGSSSTTSSRWRGEVPQPWKGCGSDAAPTTSTQPSARSAPGSWSASASRPERQRRRPGASRLPRKWSRFSGRSASAPTNRARQRRCARRRLTSRSSSG